MSQYRAQIMAHDGVLGDHFFAEGRDVGREALLEYLKGRQAAAVEGGTYKAKIRPLSAMELEYLISDLEAGEPSTYIGYRHREMARGEAAASREDLPREFKRYEVCVRESEWSDDELVVAIFATIAEARAHARKLKDAVGWGPESKIYWTRALILWPPHMTR